MCWESLETPSHGYFFLASFMSSADASCTLLNSQQLLVELDGRRCDKGLQTKSPAPVQFKRRPNPMYDLMYSCSPTSNRLSTDFLSGSDFFMFRSAALVPLDCHCDFVVLIIGVAPLPGNQTRKGPWECHDPQIP